MREASPWMPPDIKITQSVSSDGVDRRRKATSRALAASKSPKGDEDSAALKAFRFASGDAI